jgi:uncharacterized SAM-binding protein YcdF (DUF218 family)
MLKQVRSLVIIIIVIFVGFLAWGAFYLSPQDELKRADAIVAISGGDTKARTLEAVELYKDGWSRQIILSGAAYDPTSQSNAIVMREIALSEGIPPDVITVEEASTTTKQNAQEVAAIVSAFHYKKIILVTSPYHQKRASIEFRSVLSPAINHSASKDAWNPRTWWKTPRGWYLTASELPKAIFAQIVD